MYLFNISFNTLLFHILFDILKGNSYEYFGPQRCPSGLERSLRKVWVRILAATDLKHVVKFLLRRGGGGGKFTINCVSIYINNS